MLFTGLLTRCKRKFVFAEFAKLLLAVLQPLYQAEKIMKY